MAAWEITATSNLDDADRPGDNLVGLSGAKAALPPISFPLPGGNFAEIRLQKRLRKGDFKQFTDLLSAMEWCFVEADPSEDKSEPEE